MEFRWERRCGRGIVVGGRLGDAIGKGEIPDTGDEFACVTQLPIRNAIEMDLEEKKLKLKHALEARRSAASDFIISGTSTKGRLIF